MKKYNLVLPISGKAQRFIDAGYKMPKPLILVRDKHVIDLALDAMDISECQLIFIIRLDHVYNFSIDKILIQKYGPDIKIIIIDKVTRGALETCALAAEYIDNDMPLLLYTPDVYFEPKFQPNDIDPAADGYLLTFAANSPDHSYSVVDTSGLVSKVAEKEVISNDANVGIYYFRTGKLFLKYANIMLDDNMTVNNEFYIAPIYNLMIADNLQIHASAVNKMYVLGTPDAFRFFCSHVINRPFEKPIALSSDHSGYKSKQILKLLLDERGIGYIDVGTYVDKPCDYYDYLSQVIQLIGQQHCNFGISFCRSGQGMNIAANKSPIIISGLVFDGYTAELAIRHNCCNHFAIPSKYVDEQTLTAILDQLGTHTFDGGRHYTRLQKFLCS